MARINPGSGSGIITSSSPTTPGGQSEVAIMAQSTDFFPMYNQRALAGTQQLAADPSGALVTRGAVITDEGAGRANFTNSSLSFSIGTATFTNGSYTVTGSGFTALDLHFLDYVKLDADGESAWAQIAFVDSDSQLSLFVAYTGTGGTGTASASPVGTITGASAIMSVQSGQLTMQLRTTAGVTTAVYRGCSDGSISFKTSLSLSQRIANQDIYVGLETNIQGTIKSFSRFHFTGTNAAQVITETGYNPTTTPSTAEQETNTITLPGGATTLTANTFKIEQEFDQILFYVNDMLVAAHTKRVPHSMNEGQNALTADIRAVNGTTPSSSTAIVVDYMFIKNFDRLNVGTEQDFVASLKPDIKGGSQIYRLVSLATTNGNNIKSTVGQVYGWFMSNTNASPRFVKLYNSATSPTVGTTTPLMTITIPGNSNGAGTNVDFSSGISFSSGIGIAITGLVADSDTTAISANEVVVNLLYL